MDNVIKAIEALQEVADAIHNGFTSLDQNEMQIIIERFKFIENNSISKLRGSAHGIKGELLNLIATSPNYSQTIEKITGEVRNVCTVFEFNEAEIGKICTNVIGADLAKDYVSMLLRIKNSYDIYTDIIIDALWEFMSDEQRESCNNKEGIPDEILRLFGTKANYDSFIDAVKKSGTGPNVARTYLLYGIVQPKIKDEDPESYIGEHVVPLLFNHLKDKKLLTFKAKNNLSIAMKKAMMQ